MKRSRFSENRIIGILKEHPARMSALDLCRKHGISEATFYKYKAKFGGIARRDAVAHLCAVHGVSQRRACDVLAVDRSSVRYRSVRPDDAAVRDAMKEVAAERRRFGYRRIHVMLQRQGIAMNLK